MLFKLNSNLKTTPSPSKEGDKVALKNSSLDRDLERGFLLFFFILLIFSTSSYSQCVTITKEYPKRYYSEKKKEIYSYANCDTTQLVKWEHYYNDTLFEKRVYDNDSIYLAIIYENELVVDSGKWLIKKGLYERTGFHLIRYKNKIHTGEYIPLFYIDTMAYFDPISGSSIQQIVCNDGTPIGIHKTYDTSGVLLDSTHYNNEGKPVGIINIRDDKNKIINRIEYDSIGNRLYTLQPFKKPIFFELNELQYNSLKLKPDNFFLSQRDEIRIFNHGTIKFNKYQNPKKNLDYIREMQIAYLSTFNYLVVANQGTKINYYSLNTKTENVDTLINTPIPFQYQLYLSVLNNRVQIWEVQNDILKNINDFETDIHLQEAYWFDYKNILVKSTDNKYFKIQVFE